MQMQPQVNQHVHPPLHRCSLGSDRGELHARGSGYEHAAGPGQPEEDRTHSSEEEKGRAGQSAGARAPQWARVPYTVSGTAARGFLVSSSE